MSWCHDGNKNLDPSTLFQCILGVVIHFKQVTCFFSPWQIFMGWAYFMGKGIQLIEDYNCDARKLSEKNMKQRGFDSRLTSEGSTK